MKTWKQGFTGILAVIVLVFAFITCDDGGKDTHTHTWGDWTVTTAATCTTAGSRTRTCTLDPSHTETEVIPIDLVNGHTWEWKVTTLASYNADGLETETCKTCSATNGTRPQPKPSPTEFNVSFDFENSINPGVLYDVLIKDMRTVCGSATLKDIKVDGKDIITIIEEALMDAYNVTAINALQRNRFRTVFGRGVTIIIDNPVTAYKVKATDNKTIYFHIDFLKSSPADIQQIAFNTITAMNSSSTVYPWQPTE